MEITDSRIDEGKAFDWGRASEDYARYRDIYPEIFYKKITDRGLCVAGQDVLDIGTGTGVLPRHLSYAGARWTGTDISPEQIAQAKRLSEEAGLTVDYRAVPAEELDFPAASFDVVTACQCFFYFDHEKLMPILADLLKPAGRVVILYMAWLPGEDEIAAKSEKLVLKYSPGWSGAGEVRHPIAIPETAYRFFDLEDEEQYDIRIPFTQEAWHGRMRACRGVGASLAGSELAAWDREHRAMLKAEAPESFEVLHYAAMAVLRKK